MLAATPMTYWIRVAGVIAILATGCASAGSDGNPVSRGQIATQPPAIPGPLAPTGPGPMPMVKSEGTPIAVVGEAVPNGPIPIGYLSKAVNPPVAFPGLGDPRIRIVAVVGKNNFVTDQEVRESVRQRAFDYLKQIDTSKGKEIIRDDAKEKLIYKEELFRIVEREMILDEMYLRLKKAKGAVIEDIKEYAGKTADRMIREKQKAWRVTNENDFRAILTAQGLSLPILRRQIERKVMADEYVKSMMKEKGKSIGMQQIRDYYEKNPSSFQTTDRVKWLDIFISFNKFANNPRTAFDHATAIRIEAANGADFAALSLKHDDGIAGRQKGEGIGQKRGEILPVDLEPVVWSLKAGEVSELIQVPAGYHIIKVVERDYANLRPFDQRLQSEIREKLIEITHNQEYRKLVEDLWRRGVVQIINDGM